MLKTILDFIKGIFSNDIDIKNNNKKKINKVKNNVKRNKNSSVTITNNIGDNQNGK